LWKHIGHLLHVGSPDTTIFGDIHESMDRMLGCMLAAPTPLSSVPSAGVDTREMACQLDAESPDTDVLSVVWLVEVER
jgi:hypothetical protein